MTHDDNKNTEENDGIIEPQVKAVMYTDGSAKPNPGFYGWGAHGYLYLTTDEGVTKNKPMSYLVTDKGYIDAGEVNRKDYVLVNPTEYLDWRGSYESVGTNNEAEIQAFIMTVKKLITMQVNEILVKTDSQYLLHIIDTIIRDKQDDWINKVTSNIKYWYTIKDLLEILNDNDIKLVTAKVKGHSIALGNNLADKLALLARLNSSRYMINSDTYDTYNTKGYWKPKTSRHPFLFYKRLFFTNNEPVEESGRVTYSILDYDKDNEIGKKLHTASYGVVSLATPVNEIETVKKAYKDYMGGISVVSAVSMDALYNATNYGYIERYGPDVLTCSKSIRKVVQVLEEDIVCAAIQPPGLAFKALENTIILKSMVHDYNVFLAGGKLPLAKEFIKIDSLFYTDDAKPTLRPDITNVTKVVTYEYIKDGKSIKIPIQLGKDIITRNQLKKIEKQKPNIYLIVINQGNVKIDYFTLIHLESTGDIGVWCNYYANTLYLAQ